MKNVQHPFKLRTIPVERIAVLNPRSRNRRIFDGIVASISHLGLKRPVTVSPRKDTDGSLRYDLVCGQGRLEAYMALGQTEIPALVIELSVADCLVMSLVENIARRQRGAVELLREIGALRERGYSHSEIARKIGLTVEYTRGIARLLERGEVRLLNAVEKGRVPLRVAIEIAESDEAGVQAALQRAYQEKELRGNKLIAVRKLIERRRLMGKGFTTRSPNDRGKGLSTAKLLKAYRDASERQRMMVKRAELVQGRLVFVVEALRRLFRDENFATLLRAESIADMPKPLRERMATDGRS